MSIAIKTTYHGYTNRKPERVKATAMEINMFGKKPRTVTLNWDQGMSPIANHKEPYGQPCMD